VVLAVEQHWRPRIEAVIDAIASELDCRGALEDVSSLHTVSVRVEFSEDTRLPVSIMFRTESQRDL
jgi:hypothetical protein